METVVSGMKPIAWGHLIWIFTVTCCLLNVAAKLAFKPVTNPADSGAKILRKSAIYVTAVLRPR